MMHEYPWLRSDLGLAWRSYTTWYLAIPHVTRVPIDQDIVLACAVVALMWNWKRTAAALLCAFFGMLRPGEIKTTKMEHVRILRAAGRGKDAVVFVVVTHLK